MQREYFKTFSPILQRDMEMLAFGHAGAKVLIFPTRRGHFYDYEDWGLVESLRPALDQGRIQLWCVDSLDIESLYARDKHPSQRISRHVEYEGHIIHEAIPFINARNPDPALIAHGCSLGAYHAANIVFRHPRLFTKLIALSGRYDLTLAIEHFRDLFEGHYEDTLYFHQPSHYLPNLADPDLIADIARVELILAIGEEDPFKANNLELQHILEAKGIPATLHFWPGRAHCPVAWLEMVPRYFP